MACCCKPKPTKEETYAPSKPDICCKMQVKESAEAQEFFDLFWAHANSATIVVRDETYELPAPRSAFADEPKSSLFYNTKNDRDLLVNCFGVDLDTMGEMMGGPVFQKMGEVVWEPLNPATDMFIQTAEAPEIEEAPPKKNVVAVITLKEGVTVEEYTTLFWQHATSTTVDFRGETFDLGKTRNAPLLDESKTKVYQNQKKADQLAITLCDVDMAGLGELMEGEQFKALGEKTFDMEYMHFLSSMPPPPAPEAAEAKTDEKAEEPEKKDEGAVDV